MVHKQKSVWVQKTDAGRPEKLVINFVWSNGILCTPPPPPPINLFALLYALHHRYSSGMLLPLGKSPESIPQC